MARPATSAVGLFTGRPRTASVRLLSGNREPVRLVALANVDISVGGLVTCDGVVTVAGNRILLSAQTDTTENGIYNAAAGPWYRASDAASPRAITRGVQVRVQEGATKALSTWEFRTTLPNIGDVAISVVEYNVSTAFGFGVMDMLTLGGTADALTATFNPTFTVRTIGQLLRIRTTLANTDAMTLNPNTFGVIPMKMPDGTAIPAGAVNANTDYILRDNGTNLLLLASNVTF